MRPPRPHPCVTCDYPVAAFDTACDLGAGGEDFETAFVARDCAGSSGAESGGQGGKGGVGALDGVYVGGIQGGGEGAEG